MPAGFRTAVLEMGLAATATMASPRPALLLLHGWMASAGLNWHGVAHGVGAEFRVVAPDLRGHGRFGGEGPRFTMGACADDQAALIAQLGLGPVIVVGYSMGGAVAQLLARRHPGLVKGLVLCATAPTFAQHTWRRPAVKVAGRVTGTAARLCPSMARAVLRRRLRGLEQADGAGAGADHPGWALDDRGQASLAAYLEAGAALNAFDSRGWLHELDVPTAVVLTERDKRVLPWRQDALVALVPGARRFPVDAGHDAVVAERTAFAAVLAQACRAVTDDQVASPA